MKIFNQDKTQELTQSEVDLTRGYLTADKLFIQHHEAVEAVEEASHYETVKEYPNGGKDVKKVIDTPAVEAREAYDEYEDIQIFVPYSDEEIEERKKAQLRAKRTSLLEAFDKWEKAVLRGREDDSEDIMAWYRALLALDEAAFDNVPERIEYYLGGGGYAKHGND